MNHSIVDDIVQISLGLWLVKSGIRKVIQINTVSNNSTGRIMHDIQIASEKAGFQTLSIIGIGPIYSDVPCVRYGSFFSFWLHFFLTVALDMHGWGSKYQTKKIVQRLIEEKPDIIHLHNIHGYYINLPILFDYLSKEYSGEVFWTLHDCWSYTGHCAFYSMICCDKWKERCEHCPNKHNYPASYLYDGSKRNYEWKRQRFLEIKNMHLLVPSTWMKEQVSSSFWANNDIQVVPNGIDLGIFYPRKDPYIIDGCKFKDKKVILGVANVWEERKGLGVFLDLAVKLDYEYIVLLVGLSSRQCKDLPPNVIGFQRIESTDKLAQIYSMADVFINPSEDETFSLVVVEAMACGTPVIVRKGSAPAGLINDICGMTVAHGDVEEYASAIRKVELLKEHSVQIAEYAKRYSRETMQNKVLDEYAKCFERYKN